MTSRTHKVLVKTDPDGTESYGICEAHYDSPKEKTFKWCTDFIEPYGENLEELKENLEHILAKVDRAIAGEENQILYLDKLPE